MELQIKIVEALVDLLKTGGNYAIWGIIAWWIMNIIKVLILSLVVFFSLKLCIQAVTHWLTIKELSNKDKITLLSKDCSDNLEAMISQFQKDTTGAMKNFLMDAENLLKEQDDCQKKE